MINYEQVLQKFNEYVNSFDKKNKYIAIKTSHSYHVADLANILGKRLELTEEEILLAKTIGLLHDIGRFKQIEKTGKVDDAKTNTDHAKMAIDYLFYEEHIKDFSIDEKYFDIIKASIENHNKLQIEDNLNEKELFFTHLIRDIDKIDIFRVMATNFDVTYQEDITEEVKKLFFNHQIIDYAKIKNSSDTVLYYLSYIYDINFKEAITLLEDTDNIELYLSSIDVAKEKEDEFNKIKNEVRKYLESRNEEC